MTVYKYLGNKRDDDGVVAIRYEDQEAGVGETLELDDDAHDRLSNRFKLRKADEADSDAGEREQDNTANDRGVKVNLTGSTKETTA
jgi:hypothetical protein